MENQTRFNLNAAIESWRNELAAQPNLAPDDRHELETHLRDAIAGFRPRGLNDEESFWLARRRVGQPQQLGEEFVKVDPVEVWRERVFWMALGPLAMLLWSGASVYLAMAVQSANLYAIRHSFFLPDWVWFYLPMNSQGDLASVLRSPILFSLVRFLPIIGFAVLLAQGRMNRVVSSLESLLKFRRRFVFLAASLFAIYYLWLIFAITEFAGKALPGPQTPSVTIMVQRPLAGPIVVAMLVGLVAWLMPAQDRKTSKPA